MKIVCYDFVDETMQFVKTGVITGSLGQDPFAQGHDPAIRLYNYLVEGWCLRREDCSPGRTS